MSVHDDMFHCPGCGAMPGEEHGFPEGRLCPFDRVTCRVCYGTGWVVSADPTDGTPYESACPEPVHDLDTGDVRDPEGDEAAHG